MSIVRGQNFTRTKTGKRSWRHEIADRSNFLAAGADPVDGWAPVVRGVDPTKAAAGFTFGQDQGAYTYQLRDAMDVGKRSLLKRQLTADPSCWVSIRARNVNAVDATDEAGQPLTTGATRAVYRNIRDGVTYSLDLGPARMSFDLVGDTRDAAIAAGEMQFVAQTGPGCRLENRNGGISMVRKSDGAVIDHTSAPTCYDENGSRDAPNMVGYLRLTGEEDAGGQVVAAWFEAASLAGAAPGRVTYDPTTVISGTTDIEDSMIQGNLATSNRGGLSEIWAGSFSSILLRTLFRFSVGSIPGGSTITDSYMTLTNSIIHITIPWIYTMPITDANAWVEGSQNSAPEAGAINWNWLAHPSTAWAGGSPGCGVVVDDYDNSATKTQMAIPSASSSNNYDIDPAAVQGWLDGARINNGILLKGFGDGLRNPGDSENVAPRSYGRFYSTEAVSGQPTVTVTYDLPVGTIPWIPILTQMRPHP
jgi:hypothetical protein